MRDKLIAVAAASLGVLGCSSRSAPAEEPGTAVQEEEAPPAAPMPQAPMQRAQPAAEQPAEMASCGAACGANCGETPADDPPPER